MEWQQSDKLRKFFFGRLLGAGFSADEAALLLITNSKVVLWDIVHGQQIWRTDTIDGGEGYDWHQQTYRAAGETYRLIGLDGGQAIHQHPNGWRLSVNTARAEVLVKHPDSGEQVIAYNDFSGDWAAATFSVSGRYLLVLEPDYIALYEHGSAVSHPPQPTPHGPRRRGVFSRSGAGRGQSEQADMKRMSTAAQDAGEGGGVSKRKPKAVIKRVLFLLGFVLCYSVFTYALFGLTFIGSPDIDRGPAPVAEQRWGKVFDAVFGFFGLPLFSPLLWSTRYPWGQRLLYGSSWEPELLWWSALFANSTVWGVCLMAWRAKRHRRP